MQRPLISFYRAMPASFKALLSYTNNQNEAKLPRQSPLHARRRFIGALVLEAPLDHKALGLIKPTTLLRLRCPGPERSALNNANIWR